MFTGWFLRNIESLWSPRPPLPDPKPRYWVETWNKPYGGWQFRFSSQDEETARDAYETALEDSTRSCRLVKVDADKAFREEGGNSCLL